MGCRIVLLLFIAGALFGQNILYNQERDKTAQDTVEAAKQVKSSALAATEMRNLGVIEQNQVKSAIEWYRITMRTNIQAFRQWRDVKEAIDAVREELEAREEDLGIAPRLASTVAELEARRKDVAARAADLRKAVTAAKNAADQAAKRTAEAKPSAELQALVDRAGQFDELLGFAKKLTDSLPSGSSDPTEAGQGLRDDLSAEIESARKAVDDIRKGIQEVQELAQSVESIIDSWKNIRVDPASLAPSPEKIALELLQREAEFIKTLTAIRVRRYLEVAETRQLLRRFDAEFGRCKFSDAELSSQVTQDLARFVGSPTTREDLEVRLLTLLLAAQIAARQTGGQTMNDLRESIEYRRYQVSRHSVYNGSYETALQAAAARLAAYYASGLKPTQVAQLLYQLGTAVALPYIAITK